MTVQVSLRPARPDDLDFLYRVYASTRTEELERLIDWSEDQKTAFLAMQFTSQRQSYLLQFPDAEHQVILRDGSAVGRLVVNRSPDSIHLVDLALLPEHRGAGIGTTLIQKLQAEALEVKRPLRLHVLTFNRARRLYDRLGFGLVAERDVYAELEWQSSANNWLETADLTRHTIRR
jgi:ribosomal protein S18 acetylase RimI-like enzyme